MKRQDVLTLLERHPDLFDADDELLRQLLLDSPAEPAERDNPRPEPLWRSEVIERPVKSPR